MSLTEEQIALARSVPLPTRVSPNAQTNAYSCDTLAWTLAQRILAFGDKTCSDTTNLGELVCEVTEAEIVQCMLEGKLAPAILNLLTIGLLLGAQGYTVEDFNVLSPPRNPAEHSDGVDSILKRITEPHDHDSDSTPKDVPPPGLAGGVPPVQAPTLDTNAEGDAVADAVADAEAFLKSIRGG